MGSGVSSAVGYTYSNKEEMMDGVSTDLTENASFHPIVGPGKGSGSDAVLQRHAESPLPPPSTMPGGGGGGGRRPSRDIIIKLHETLARLRKDIYLYDLFLFCSTERASLFY